MTSNYESIHSSHRSLNGGFQISWRRTSVQLICIKSGFFISHSKSSFHWYHLHLLILFNIFVLLSDFEFVAENKTEKNPVSMNIKERRCQGELEKSKDLRESRNGGFISELSFDELTSQLEEASKCWMMFIWHFCWISVVDFREVDSTTFSRTRQNYRAVNL